MDRETQIVLIAGALGIVGTLLGTVIQTISSERSEKRHQLEQQRTTIRLERREAFVRLIGAIQVAVVELDDATAPAYTLGEEETFARLKEEELQNLIRVARESYAKLSQARLGIELFQSGTVGDKAYNYVNHHIGLETVLGRGNTKEDFVKWTREAGIKHRELVAAMRKDLGYE